jgi:hypothetical protein
VSGSLTPNALIPIHPLSKKAKTALKTWHFQSGFRFLPSISSDLDVSTNRGANQKTKAMTHNTQSLDNQ